MTQQRLYAIVLRLAALRPGAIPANHGDQARAALMSLIRHGDSPLAQRLHDDNAAKPYTISLIQGGKRRLRSHDDGHHFGEGDAAEWRFTLLMEPAFDALLRRYLLNRELPHVRIGAVSFAVQDAFVSGAHLDSGHISVLELTERWNCSPEALSRSVTLDFHSPTAFSLGRDKDTGEYRIRSQPDARTLFSTLRKRWSALGGIEPGDDFDAWVGNQVEAEFVQSRTQKVIVENRPVTGFVGQARYRVHGAKLDWLPLLHLLADLTFWTGVGYQTTRGMGQVRRIKAD